MYKLTTAFNIVQKSSMENQVVRGRTKRRKTRAAREDFEDEVVARRASTGASPIRSSNFHLITALIKANRSERKHQFHYSELTVVAE